MRASDTMNRTLLLIAASAAVVGIAGCGGGGGGNGGPAAPPVNALRVLQPGDTWKYSVKADIVMANNSPTIHLKDGSYTRSVGTFASVIPPAGGAFKTKALSANALQPKTADLGLSLTDSLSLSYYGGFGVNENNVSHIFQEADGVYQVSDTRDIDGNEEGADPFVGLISKGQQQLIPNVFNDTTGFASDDSYGVVTFVPGTPAVLNPDGTIKVPAVPDKYIEKITNQEHVALAVVGREDIDTPVGKFSTFKCTVSKHFVTQGVNVDGTEWWAPQIGSFVKASLTQNIPAVGTEHLEYTLQTMHLAPAAG